MKKIVLVMLCMFFVSVACYAGMVVYNVKTQKYHSPNCESAMRCTVNCIKIDKKEAIRRGGVPCKKCGGGR